MFTVWEFKSIDGKQVVRCIRQSSHGEDNYQNDYNKILYCGPDYQKAKHFTKILDSQQTKI